jgi:serine protease Do
MNQLRNTVATLAPGAEVKINVFRGGKETDVSIKIGEQPDNVQLASRRGGGTDATGDVSGGATAEKLGVKLADPTAAQLQRFGLDAEAGALITSVNRNSPAGKTGLRAGDLITRIGDVEVSDAKSAADALANQDISKGIRMQISSRDGKRFVFVRQED